nr:MAG TPA: hypothetical protein [Caudoviricetes sp.]
MRQEKSTDMWKPVLLLRETNDYSGSRIFISS